ncbi:hypothetical protein [Streptomyces orinoci]|uniref:hypothetical protein n=1 Tax=Streptomyces orinoci TaxID=67339 RepID=UPI000D648FED|nr:hypothetical protein [Streptomyces orinoci]
MGDGRGIGGLPVPVAGRGPVAGCLGGAGKAGQGADAVGETFDLVRGQVFQGLGVQLPRQDRVAVEEGEVGQAASVRTDRR